MRLAVLPSLLPQTSRPVGLVRFSISLALCVRFRQTIHSSPTLLWVFTSTFLLLGLRVRIRSKTGLTESHSRVYSNKYSCRSWSAFGYRLRCSRLWDFYNCLLSIPATARKQSCL